MVAGKMKTSGSHLFAQQSGKLQAGLWLCVLTGEKNSVAGEFIGVLLRLIIDLPTVKVIVLHGIVVDRNEQLGSVRCCQTRSPLQRECIGGGNDVGLNVGSSRKRAVNLLHDGFVELIFWTSAGADRAWLRRRMPDV